PVMTGVTEPSRTMRSQPKRPRGPPIGIRAREPTSTGIATISDASAVSSCATQTGQSGLSSAQAQKFTPNPSVTSRSARQAPGGTVVVDGAVCAADDVVIGQFSTLEGRCAVED